MLNLNIIPSWTWLFKHLEVACSGIHIDHISRQIMFVFQDLDAELLALGTTVSSLPLKLRMRSDKRLYAWTGMKASRFCSALNSRRFLSRPTFVGTYTSFKPHQS